MTDTNTQIFLAIADLITQDEFKKSCDEFYLKNAEKFEDTEENKLEYTNIYTEYVYILEQMIEANLLAKFTNDQIEDFYSSFKEKLPEYEKLNPEVVDSLFAFIDFDKFKKAIYPDLQEHGHHEL
jgi:ADP-ribosylation factor-like protein 2-binding protein